MGLERSRSTAMSRIGLCLFLIATQCAICLGLHGTTFEPLRTRGQPWPLPQYVGYHNTLATINPAKFTFKITNKRCDILEEAVKRYSDVLRRVARVEGSEGREECHGRGDLNELELRLDTDCEVWPHFNMDEHYEMHINQTAILGSSSIWGMLRGLETFSHLVTPSPSHPGCLMINNTDILDFPRFSHRGLLIDTSRHFLPVRIILNILVAMEINKMNVLHWHIVDDQSFPYQSTSFPSLSEKGAYSSKEVYTQDDVRNIIQFARLRGIRVLPEFDSPGHTQSWGNGVSKLLTPCYTNGTLNGQYGPIDPSKSQNFKFMKGLLEEVKCVFPDKYIHIGGDEVDYTCWESSPAIKSFMAAKNISTYPELEAYYIREVLDIVSDTKASAIVWQEVFQHNANLKNDTVVHVWLGDRKTLLSQITSQGKFALLSEGWYLDHIDKQWENFYLVDPGDFNGTRVERSRVLGGEACMWGEMVDETNIVPRVWPRASAVAERLWSSASVTDVSSAAKRLNEHVCRMRRRGVAAQPASGPGFCPY